MNDTVVEAAVCTGPRPSVAVDPWSLVNSPSDTAVDLSDRLSGVAAGPALLYRLREVAEMLGREKRFDTCVHYHFLLLADGDTVSVAEERRFSEVVQSAVNFLQLYARSGVSFRVSSQSRRSFNISASYVNKSSTTSCWYLPMSRVKTRLSQLDGILEDSIHPACRNVMFALYLPQVNVINSRCVTSLRKIEGDAVSTGFEYETSSYAVNFAICNWGTDSLFKSDATKTHVLHYLRKDLSYGVDLLVGTFEFGDTIYEIKPPTAEDVHLGRVWDVLLFKSVQLIKAHEEGCVSLSILPEIVAFPTHVSLSRRHRALIASARTVLNCSSNVSSLDDASLLSIDASLRSAQEAAASLSGLLHDAALVDSTALPGHQTVLLLAPFWVPLLAPIVKWVVARIRSQSRAQV